MKNTTQTLLFVFLLFVCATVNAQAQEYFVEGQITWVNRFGVVPSAPGASTPSASPCSIFSVVALDARSKRPVAYTDQGAAPFQYSFPQGVIYVCKYSLKVPEDRDLYIMATMGNVLNLPKTDRDPFFITDTWIFPGASNRPWAGTERGFKGATFLTLRSRDQRKSQTVNFQMTYVTNEEARKVVPTFFAGAWQTNLGGTSMIAIFQQSNEGVTGQLNVNSAGFGDLRGGIVVGNTLRFNVVRRLGSMPEQFVGYGELVMDEGGKSFKGTILGVPASGTFLGS